MNIVFFTNTYVPHVGGVARSVETTAATLRELGHQVLIIAPEFHGMPHEEAGIIRVPAIQNFNASDFSVALPFSKGLTDILRDFNTEIIHSHHPFLLGTTAIRLSRALQLPLVFTHHTLYEQYTHYVVPESSRIKTFIAEIATGYANLSNQVIAPSDSVKKLICKRGVNAPVEVIPTGVDTRLFRPMDARDFCRRWKIPAGAFVIGHMGRLAPEKNIAFLAEAVCLSLKSIPDAVFLVVGDGPSMEKIRSIFEKENLSHRLRTTGALTGEALVESLNAMNVFAFASKTETQGMVISEAMATGLPVVALNASGVGDLVCDKWNGRNIQCDSLSDFSRALEWVHALPAENLTVIAGNAIKSAKKYSLVNTTSHLATVYQSVTENFVAEHYSESSLGIEPLMARLKTEWEILKKISVAGDEALSTTVKSRVSE